MIKILFLITNFEKGGAERYLVDLCNYLASRDDVDIKIGVLNAANQYKNETKNLDIIDLKSTTFSFRKRNQNLAYSSLLDSYQPDIVHSHLYMAEFFTTIDLRKNIIYFCHGHDNIIPFGNFTLNTLFSKKLFFDFIEKQILVSKKYKHFPSYFIPNSKHTEAYFKKTLPTKLHDKIIKLQYGFDFNRFHLQDTREIFTDKKLKILNVGSFQKKKNQLFLIEVAKELKIKNIDFELILIGDGEMRSSVENKIKSEKLERYVSLKGIVNDVETYYKNSDIYVHAATYEPFGLVYLEAMASGLPIVSLDGKGNKDIILNGKNGFLIQEQNPTYFASQIEKLFTQPELYAAMSEFGKKFARDFSIEKKTKELIDLYKSSLNARTMH